MIDSILQASVQAVLVDLYQVSSQAITQYIKAVDDEEKLEQIRTCKYYLQVGLKSRSDMPKAPSGEVIDGMINKDKFLCLMT